MSVEAIGLFTLAIGLLCLWLGQGATSIVFVVMSVFGAAAAVLIGDNNIQPSHLFLAFVAGVVFLRREQTVAAVRAIAPPAPGFWLAGFVGYAVITAFVLPRILEGVTQIVPLGASAYGQTKATVPLGPVSSNLTQSFYLIADLAGFMLAAAIASTRDGFKALTYGILAYAAANTIFALLDIATYYTGAQSLFDPLRNAKYAMHHEEEIAGLKRVVGSFTEASTFARSTLAVLGFTATLWLCGRYSLVSGVLALSSLMLLVVSTSSTAIAGLPVLLVILYITAWYVAVVRERLVAWAVVVLAPAFACVLVLGIFLDRNLVETVGNYMDATLLNKLGTSSGVERSFWNATAFGNFVESWGLGVGLGTARASNFFLALLSNVGVAGLLLYGMFVFSTFVRPRGALKTIEGDVHLATRNACIGLIVADLLMSSVVDQGLLFYILAGVAAAAPLRVAAKRSYARPRWEPA